MKCSPRTAFLVYVIVISITITAASNDGEYLTRSKRGVAKVLGKMVSTVVKAAVLSKKLKNPGRPPQRQQNTAGGHVSVREFIRTLSFDEGCKSYPALCTIKDELLDLEQQFTAKHRELVEQREAVAKNLSLLHEAHLNNRHLLHKITETEHTLILVYNKSECIDFELQKHLGIWLQNLPSTSDVSKTKLDFHVDRIIEAFEYRLSGMKQLFSDRKLKPIQLIALKGVVETSFKFLVYVVSQVLSTREHIQMNETNLEECLFKFLGKNMSMTPEEILSLRNSDNPEYKKTALKFGLLTSNYKLTWNLVRTMTKDNWMIGKVENSEVILTKSVHVQAYMWKAGEETTGLRMILSLPSHAIQNKYHTTNHKLRHVSETFKFTYRDRNWDASLRNSIEELGNDVRKYIEEKHWRSATEKIEELKLKYKVHIREIAEDVQGILTEKAEIPDLFKQCIHQFEDTVDVFVNFLSNETKKTFVEEVLDLKLSPANDSISLHNGNIDDKNFIHEQKIVLRHIRTIQHDLDRLKAYSIAQYMAYNYVGKATENKESIVRIYDVLHNVFAFQSGHVKDFGEDIEIAELLCIISLMRRDLDFYDGYSLESIRSNCFTHNATAFTGDALTQYRKAIVENSIMDTVRGGKVEDVSAVLDAVNGSLRRHVGFRLPSQENLLSEKDALCVIAKLFPRKDMYGFFNLFWFRRDCKKMSYDVFRKMKHNADKKRMEFEMETRKNKLCKTEELCFTLKPEGIIAKSESYVNETSAGTNPYNSFCTTHLFLASLAYIIS